MTANINVIAVLARFLAVALVCLQANTGWAEIPDAISGAALRAQHQNLQARLQQNQFLKPLYLESSETSERVTGDVYALIKHPFTTTGATLDWPERWCDIMMLHINTKYCRASSSSLGDALQINIGRKHDHPLEDGYQIDFAHRVAVSTPEYLGVVLTADTGPFSTRDYRIILEAIPAGKDSTFVHFRYSYGYGFAGRIALQTYLSTIGRGKVGFTVTGRQPDGRNLHIGGMRGLVERNTMRYYLAIEAYLGALSEPPQSKLEKQLRDWFAATELYPRQLHEIEQNEYIDMKRKEYLRLQAGRS